jgi:hypothetical protein
LLRTSKNTGFFASRVRPRDEILFCIARGKEKSWRVVDRRVYTVTVLARFQGIRDEVYESSWLAPREISTFPTSSTPFVVPDRRCCSVDPIIADKNAPLRGIVCNDQIISVVALVFSSLDKLVYKEPLSPLQSIY